MLNKIMVDVDGKVADHDESIFCKAWRAVFALVGQGKLGDRALLCNGRPWGPVRPPRAPGPSEY